MRNKMKTSTLYLFIYVSFGGICCISAIWEKFGPLNLGLKMMKCEHNKNLNLDVSEMNVHLYDFKKDETKIYPIKEAANGILSWKDLDKTRKFYIFVSGYNTYINHSTADLVRNTFKDVSNSYFIYIDHSPYTNGKGNKKKSYERSVKYVYYIGASLAQMLVTLNQGGISPTNIHCIGHSLGSQILGHVGENFLKATGQKIARITALDPAGPCFSNSFIQEQIRSGIAEYVEVYHCNAGALGTSSVLGDIDFFVNKGKKQPHCVTAFIPGIIDGTLSANCNHKTCVAIWMASVDHPDWYIAFKCDKYKDFRDGKCSRNDKTFAGFWNPGTAKGVYYFSTEGLL